MAKMTKVIIYSIHSHKAAIYNKVALLMQNEKWLNHKRHICHHNSVVICSAPGLYGNDEIQNMAASIIHKN